MDRIGVDIVAVARLQRALDRTGPRFLAKSFTPGEIAECRGSAERLAGRWAAKEAVMKCFDGTGICFPRSKIEVLPAASGAPRVRLLGDGRGASIQVSITHHAGVAIAAAALSLPAATQTPLPAPDAVVLPPRPLDGHKGSFGTVVVLAGSMGLTGAAYLASTAAARAGAGLVRLLVAETIYPILAAKCTEVMATPVSEVAPGSVGHSAHDAILRHMATAKAAVLGPGLGRDSSTWRLIHDLVPHVRCPMVLDADALNALAADPRLLKRLGPDRILTPHPGEMSRLLRRSVDQIQADREGAAVSAAREWGAVVVLKGARTVVAAPDGRVSVDPHEVPALASGGTGDVLAGVIGALVAQGSEPYAAAATAVYLHAESGRRVAADLGDAGLLASDLLPEIPRVMNVLRQGGL